MNKFRLSHDNRIYIIIIKPRKFQLRHIHIKRYEVDEKVFRNKGILPTPLFLSLDSFDVIKWWWWELLSLLISEHIKLKREMSHQVNKVESFYVIHEALQAPHRELSFKLNCRPWFNVHFMKYLWIWHRHNRIVSYHECNTGF